MMAFFHGGDALGIVCLYGLFVLGLFILFICVMVHISRNLMERADRKNSKIEADKE